MLGLHNRLAIDFAEQQSIVGIDITGVLGMSSAIMNDWRFADLSGRKVSMFVDESDISDFQLFVQIFRSYGKISRR